MKYKYVGQEEVSLPTLGITVKNGNVVESPVEINHPDFEPLVETIINNQQQEVVEQNPVDVEQAPAEETVEE